MLGRHPLRVAADEQGRRLCHLLAQRPAQASRGEAPATAVGCAVGPVQRDSGLVALRGIPAFKPGQRLHLRFPGSGATRDDL